MNNTPKGPVTILGDAYVGETLIARPNGIGDADGIDYLTETFQWLRDGTAIQGATGRTYDVTLADVGAQLSIRYTYFDFGGTLEILTSDPEPAVPPAGTPIPVDTGPYNPLMILGEAVVGDTLTARPNAVTDPNGIDSQSIGFQWLRDGNPIPGATAQAYDVTDSDIGAEISVEFTYVDLLGTARSLTSNPKAEVPVPVLEEVPPTPPIDETPSDLLNGTSDADALRAASGLKRINGLDDTDTVYFEGHQSNYTVTISGDTVSVSDHRYNGLGTIALDSIELIDFTTELPEFDGPFDLRTFGGLSGLEAAAVEDLIEIYIAYFDRAPDAIGLNFWGSAFANGLSLDEIAALFADQDETRATYPEGTSSSEFASSVYSNVLGRNPDTAGLAFWTEALDSGTVSRDQLIIQMLEGARAPLKIDRGHEFVSQQIADQQYLDSKIDIGAFFAVHRGLTDVTQAEVVMDLYDGTTSGLIAAVDAIDTYYDDAQNPFDGGAFLLQIVGLLDSPFLD